MTEEKALILESVLIELDDSCYPACGYNHAEYGTTGWQATEEQRAELSGKKKQYIAEHPEYIENLATARRGKPRAEETKKKISGTLKGVPLTEEAKANLLSSAFLFSLCFIYIRYKLPLICKIHRSLRRVLCPLNLLSNGRK